MTTKSYQDTFLRFKYAIETQFASTAATVTAERDGPAAVVRALAWYGGRLLWFERRYELAGIAAIGPIEAAAKVRCWAQAAFDAEDLRGLS